MENKKRSKIIFVCILVLASVLFFLPHDWQNEATAMVYKKEAIPMVYKKEKVFKEPELSETRKELEKLYEERGTESHLTET